jgi:hypothetical protein
VLGPFL